MKRKNNRWHSIVLADKERNRSVWYQEHPLLMLCRYLGPEYCLEKIESFPDIDSGYVIHRNLGDGYDIEIIRQGYGNRRSHFIVSLWAENGRRCVKTFWEIYGGKIPECVDDLIRKYVPDRTVITGKEEERAEEFSVGS